MDRTIHINRKGSRHHCRSDNKARFGRVLTMAIDDEAVAYRSSPPESVSDTKRFSWVPTGFSLF